MSRRFANWPIQFRRTSATKTTSPTPFEADAFRATNTLTSSALTVAPCRNATNAVSRGALPPPPSDRKEAPSQLAPLPPPAADLALGESHPPPFPDDPPSDRAVGESHPPPTSSATTAASTTEGWSFKTASTKADETNEYGDDTTSPRLSRK
jgi:hypothetical protein